MVGGSVLVSCLIEVHGFVVVGCVGSINNASDNFNRIYDR